MDAGNPVQQTATATVSISVEDVNNKPPKFTEESYVEYISESMLFLLFLYYLSILDFHYQIHFTLTIIN